jgi:amino acid transporter
MPEPAHQPAPESPGAAPHFKRVLSRGDLIVYGLVILTPTAAYPVLGYVQQRSVGHAALGYLVAMVAMLFTAASYGKMAVAFPTAGSTYTFAQRSLSDHVGFMAGWAMILDYFLIPLLSVVYMGVTMHKLFLGIPYFGKISEVSWAIIFTVAITLINLRGIRVTARASQVMMVIMTACALLFVWLAGRWVVAAHGFAGLFSPLPVLDLRTFALPALMSGASLAALSYIGFDAITTLAEDTLRPERDIPCATVLVCVLETIICFLTVYLAALVSPEYMFKNGPSAYSQGEIKNLAAFASKLKGEKDPVSVHLINRFPAETRRALTAYAGPGPGDATLEASLVRELNAVLAGPSLYETNRFAGVSLSDRTKELLKKKQEGADLARLNRYLADDAYPQELSRLDPETVILEISRRIGGRVMFGLVIFVLLVAGLASALTGQAGASRLLFGMGRDGVLPRRIFGYLDPRRSTPTRGIYLMSAITLVGAAFLKFDEAAELLNFGAFVGFILVNLSVVAHYYIRLRRRRGLEFLTHLVFPGLGALVCGYVWLNLSRVAMQVGFAWFAVGLIYLAVLTRGFRVKPKSLGSSLKEGG